jgi:hypothetical protein
LLTAHAKCTTQRTNLPTAHAKHPTQRTNPPTAHAEWFVVKLAMIVQTAAWQIHQELLF